MRKKYVIFLTAGLIFIASGCVKPSKSLQGYWDAAIAYYQDQDYNGCVKEYNNLVKYYPQDSLAVKSLFAVSEIYKNNLNNMEKAIETYRRIIKDYSSSEKAPNALFMIGYIYANELNDLTKAKECYTEFIKKYPDHILAPSAQWELDNLGKPLDEIPQLQAIKKK